jgi:hypothetical protein
MGSLNKLDFTRNSIGFDRLRIYLLHFCLKFGKWLNWILYSLINQLIGCHDLMDWYGSKDLPGLSNWSYLPGLLD